MIYKIHPAIGIARVGDSEEYYLPPEESGELPVLPAGRKFQETDFRDSYLKLRRQAVRFQVFSYDESHPNQPGLPVEAGQSGVDSIEWTVHVANKKAIWYQSLANAGEDGYSPEHPLRNAGVTARQQRLERIIDPGPRTLTGPGKSAAFSRKSSPPFPYKMTFPPLGLKPATIDSLGEMHTDAQNRLIFVGGYGNSGSSAASPVISDFANNDDWWDDICDGPVRATIKLKDGSKVEAISSWVVVAPPRYAPQLVNLVTLYDVLFDISVRFLDYVPDIFAGSMWNRNYHPSWERDIRPILERARGYQWVVAVPPKPHEFDFQRLGDPNSDFNAYRKYYLGAVRSPDRTNEFASSTTGLPSMPYIAGDNCVAAAFMTSNYMTLTRTQYFFLQQWAAGKFKPGTARKQSASERLDRVALEQCVGGAFCPGIEMTWINRNPRIYSEPFRIHRKDRNTRDPLSLGADLESGMEPGDVTKYMALPWQADFNACSSQQIGDRFLWWWPVQRPAFVFIEEDGGKKQVGWVGTIDDQNASDYVQFADSLDMVRDWNRLGFVFDKGCPNKADFFEVARTLPRPKK